MLPVLGIFEKCVKFESINSKAPCFFPKVGKMLFQMVQMVSNDLYILKYKHKNGVIDNVEITNEECSCIECNKFSCSSCMDIGICSHILAGCVMIKKNKMV